MSSGDRVMLVDERYVRVEQVRHSTEMDGGRTSDQVRAMQDRRVRGEISGDELVQLTLEQGQREVRDSSNNSCHGQA